jgi:hypothetical protein
MGELLNSQKVIRCDLQKVEKSTALKSRKEPRPFYYTHVVKKVWIISSKTLLPEICRMIELNSKSIGLKNTYKI